MFKFKLLRIFLFLFLFLFLHLDAKKYEKFDDHSLKIIDQLMGNFKVENHSDFKVVPRSLSYKKTYLRKEVLQAFLKMERAAKKDGIKLVIISGFRSYKYQNAIWNKKYKNYSKIHSSIKERVENILQYSSIPGISRHHWGSDLDINSLNNNYFLNGRGRKTHQWLKEHSSEYGFYLTYTFDRHGGYQPEMWHYTYYPVSSKIMKAFYLYVTPKDIESFAGASSVNITKIFHDYSFNINPIILDKMRLDEIVININY